MILRSSYRTVLVQLQGASPRARIHSVAARMYSQREMHRLIMHPNSSPNLYHLMSLFSLLQ